MFVEKIEDLLEIVGTKGLGTIEVVVKCVADALLEKSHRCRCEAESCSLANAGLTLSSNGPLAALALYLIETHRKPFGYTDIVVLIFALVFVGILRVTFLIICFRILI